MLDIPGLQKDVILAPLTTYKIGGPADMFVETKTADELTRAVSAARKAGIPYFILGTGANILITDKGFRGLVIWNRADAYEFLPNNLLRAESGAVMADLIEACKEKELSGLEHFAGIPSSVGGALWQNLHFLAPDRQSTYYIEAVLVEATVLEENGEVKKVGKDYFQFGYDESIMHHREVIVLNATFQLQPKPRAEIQKQIDANLLWRTSRQPQLWEYPSCGSVFKKIQDAGAGRLIQEVGLKGHQIGGAQISNKHANYIINTGNAKAEDVLSMIALVKKEVKEKLGYGMETEIGIIGER